MRAAGVNGLEHVGPVGLGIDVLRPDREAALAEIVLQPAVVRFHCLDQQHARPAVTLGAADGFRRHQWQGEPEGRAEACRTGRLHPYRPTVALHQLASDREAESHSAEALANRLGRAMEFVEHASELLGTDTDAGIGDRDLHFAVRDLGFQGNAAGVGELDRIAEQVEHHLAEPRPVAEDPGAGGGKPGPPLQSLLSRHLLSCQSGVKQDFGEVERLPYQV